MEIVKIKLDELQEWENNARIHTKRNLEALKQSLKDFTQTKPILVQKSTMRIIAGNGTYEAAKALGWESIECNILDLDDARANALAIADNRTGDLSEWNEKYLTEALEGLKTDGLLDLTGYNSNELEQMLKFQNGDMFEKITPNTEKEKAGADAFPPKKEEREKKEPPKKEKEKPMPSPVETDEEFDALPNASAPYDRQISFTMDGFIFNLSDVEKLSELRALLDLLKGADHSVQDKVNDDLFQWLANRLTDEFLR